MTIKDYFRAKKPKMAAAQAGPAATTEAPPPLPPPPPPAVMTMAPTPPAVMTMVDFPPPPPIAVTSPAQSSRSSASADDIKHEVMVNFLYHQQEREKWIEFPQDFKRATLYGTPKYPRTPVGDDLPTTTMTGLDFVGRQEGVLLRKSRGNYIACPPALIGTPFEMACRSLNVSVSTMLVTAPRKPVRGC